MGTLRARPSALNARALGVPSWGPLQQIQAPGGRFQPWGPREGTPRIRAPTADRGGLGVGPLAPPRPALCRQLHPWGSPGRDPPSPTVQSGLGGSGGGSPPSPTVQSATSLSPTQKRLTQNCRPGADPSALGNPETSGSSLCANLLLSDTCFDQLRIVVVEENGSTQAC